LTNKKQINWSNLKKKNLLVHDEIKIKTRKNAIVEYLDYQIPVTQLNGDMQAAKRHRFGRFVGVKVGVANFFRSIDRY